MSKHHPMESCKDFIAKPHRRFKGVLAQCRICKTKFIGVVGYWGGAVWRPVKAKGKF